MGDFKYDCVPERWPGSTAVIFAGGPSLTYAQVRIANKAWLRPGVFTIAVNDCYRLAGWADVQYACDTKWWRAHGAAVLDRMFALHFTMSKWAATEWPAVQCLRNTGLDGLESDRDGLRNGRNGGYQAINLAVHLGATRIVLLGYDMKCDGLRTHWHGGHEFAPHDDAAALGPRLAETMLPHFSTLVEPLAARGVEVLNATPGSALTCFPKVDLARVLAA